MGWGLHDGIQEGFYARLPDPRPADLTGDGVVDISDLLAVLADYGPCADCDSCPADLNGNCGVDFVDVLAILQQWGPCP